MSRFFVSPGSIDLNRGIITIEGEDVRHISNVLRAAPGDTLVLSDGSGMDYEAVIDRIDREYIITRIADTRPNYTEPPIEITLFQGLPKADKMEAIIQKCVELGVKRIVPVITARTVVKLKGAKDIASKTTRWKRIALEAAKQCDRGIVPEVEEPVEFLTALEKAGGCTLNLIPYEEEREGSLKRLLREYGGSEITQREIAILIGPEGGFEPAEVEEAIKSGFCSVTLGPRILRTETAGMAVAAIIMYEIGDMGK